MKNNWKAYVRIKNYSGICLNNDGLEKYVADENKESLSANNVSHAGDCTPIHKEDR
jgi:hypothetical protein